MKITNYSWSNRGQGHGAYPVWIDRTDDGQVGCVVVDFQLHSAGRGE
ncbi:hypothetical protein [Streptomyces cyaneofuscatus]